MPPCIATALVFSGRTDPQWPLAESWGERLAALWQPLTPLKGEKPPSPTRLGYRGCRFECQGWSYTIYRTTVCRVRGEEVECRADPTHTIERELIGTAPPGLLPPGIVDL